MHNVRLADPEDFYTKEIAKLTRKRSMTEEDRSQKYRLEWLGSLYTENDRVVVPQHNIQKCLIETAKITRKGKDVARALTSARPESPFVPLVFPDMECKPEELYELGGYRDMTIVGVGKSRVPRCRPGFPEWRVTAEWFLIPTVLDPDEFRDLAVLSGMVEGLGDNRINGMGRFEMKVTIA